MKRLAVLGLMTGTLLVLASCGGGDDGPIDETPTPTETASSTSTATGTPTATRAAASIGTVTDAAGDARVNGERASQNLRLRAGDRIETKASSSINFALTDTPATECSTLADSILDLHPDQSTVVRWLSRKGVSFCSVERGAPPVVAWFGLDPDVRIEVEATLFGISQSTLRVVEGFVTYHVGQSTQRLGPNEEITFSSSGQPGQKQTWDGLDPDESEMVADLQGRRPSVSLTPTAAERQSSRLIRAMQQQPALYVLIDESAEFDDEDFVTAYFERLAEAWFGTGAVQVERVARAGAMLVLEQKAFAVYVGPPAPPPPTATPQRVTPTPTRTPTTAAGTATAALPHDLSPFYVDGDQRVWSIEFVADPGAKSAFARFTKGILTNGEYYDFYADIFGEAPPYDRLLDLLR